MLPWLLVIMVLAGAPKYTSGAPGDECTSPANKTGECRRLRECPALLTKLERGPLPAADKQFIRDSVKVCPLPPVKGNPGVCCETDTWKNDPKCGIVDGSRLLAGNETRVGHHPWMVLLGYNAENRTELSCVGSLINSRWVLTAAHCIRNSLTTVRLGEHDLTTNPDCEELEDAEYCHPEHSDVLVLRTVKHPDYTRKTLSNDIALIELDSPVEYREEILPVCLPLGESGKLNLESMIMTVAGWGRSQEAAPVMMHLSVHVTSNASCNAAYTRTFRGADSISSELMCVDGHERLNDACQVDIGGPLTMSTPVNGRVRWMLFGLDSYGPSTCGSPGLPVVYTRVSEYIRWIGSVVNG